MKWIAVLLMILDHTGAYLQRHMGNGEYLILRGVGRLAFPIFAYMIGVGINRTRSKFKYFIRMSVFAALSEFLLQFTARQTGYPPRTNVLLTFVLSMVFIFAWEAFVKSWHRLDEGQLLASGSGENVRPDKNSIWNALVLIGNAGIMFAVLYMAGYLENWNILRPDYGVYGILSVFIFYYVNKNMRKNALPLRKDMQAFSAMLIGFAFINFFWYFIFGNGSIQILSILAIPLLLIETKRKNIPGAPEKYFFYFFYPLHCCFLMFISSLL